MVAHIVCHCGIKKDHTILDFGCARGYTVKALRRLGYTAIGCDVSKWAINNADPAVVEHVAQIEGIPLLPRVDWVIAKDVLEHVQELNATVNALMGTAKQGMFVVVPLAENGDEKYDVPEYEADITHIHRKPLAWWGERFMRQGWSVDVRYRLPGVKDNYAQYSTGNGFLTCRRLSD